MQETSPAVLVEGRRKLSPVSLGAKLPLPSVLNMNSQTGHVKRFLLNF
jgi:hypothetical protein